MGLLKCPRSSWEASWMHTHLVSFDELSYIYSSSASVAWQSLLLVLTSIDGHLHSLFISCVNVRLSPFFVFSHNPYHHTLLHPLCYIHGLRSCIAQGLKKLKRVEKYETIAWLVIGVVHDESILVWRKWSMTKLYNFVGMNFLWPCYFEKTWLLC